MATTTIDIVHLNAPSNFPIKLTPLNFPVWRRQVQSTLVGFNLLGYIDGSIKEPAKFNDTAQTTPNPAHLTWYRQDQIITSALLGSCSDTIQPLIASAPTACDAWQRLVANYASASRGRIISLKAKLTRNPKGDEYSSIVSAVRVRDKPISLGELADVLTDHERQLAKVDDARQSLLATANASQRGPSASHNSQHSTADRRSRNNTNNTYGNNRPNWSHNSNTRPGVVCQFCHLVGHETRVCRKLARFLKAHNVFPLVQKQSFASKVKANSRPK
ncbi:PREDICTED: uncharacterized protein LOC109150404 [Ipomoea nil]|uniref:uncharacterized protein LOC109150404 n=1 Tax=Ipomoea nil TaxID=35883 RepID=UPI000900E543|nr:PREDICTED: uncharacterized protein LOC109150404 [Ipomoea nil]